MEAYEDDDDTHFCIKCHTTITGLNNYVSHRQSRCQTSEKTVVESDLVSPTPPAIIYPEILNADLFFSSLELQSSAKSNQPRTPLLENFKRTRNNVRKKMNQKANEKLHEGSGMLPSVADLDDPTENLSMPSLEGFPDIVTSNKASSTSNVKLNLEQTDSKIETLINDSKPTESKRQEDEDEDEEEEEGEEEEEEDPRRLDQSTNEIWLDEDDVIMADFEDSAGNKEMTEYNFQYQQDEESSGSNAEEVEDEEDDASGEVVSSESEFDDCSRSQKHPPVGHTGGKWKPGQADLAKNLGNLHAEELELEEDHLGHHPPPSFTGGKWKPTRLLLDLPQRSVRSSVKDDEEQPPPSDYTRGKWVTREETKADNKQSFWCAPCGRKLASELMYKRHLRSNLHAKRSLREFDNLKDGLVSTAFLFRKSTRLAKETEEEDESGEDCAREKSDNVRRRQKRVLTCKMCKSRVKRLQIGKHLLSHYHCRVAGTNPSEPEDRRFLLKNMRNIIRHCPFQCSPCRFFCNTREQFLYHWRSTSHSTTMNKIVGSFKCNLCDFVCRDNENMETHLLSNIHQDIVSLMNQSVPMVISRQSELVCSTCKRQFRYNLQLRLHAEETGHDVMDTASNEYQGRFVCPDCPKIARSFMKLQHHRMIFHCDETKLRKRKIEGRDDEEENSIGDYKENDAEENHASGREGEEGEKSSDRFYYCSFCSLQFHTARESMIHRRTIEHKETRKKCLLSKVGPAMTIRECVHCREKQTDLVEHKKHLLERHPDLCYSCGRCGRLFAFSQDVTRHTKSQECVLKVKEVEKEKPEKRKNFQCDFCPYSTDSNGEYLFHEALHNVILSDDENQPTCSKSGKRYRCPLCDKVFRKLPLRNHIMSHTGERPFSCFKCHASYIRRYDLKVHQKECMVNPDEASYQRQRKYACSTCTATFYTKYALSQHMQRHEGKKFKCGLPGCPTILRTQKECELHRKLVHEKPDRLYFCSECSYTGKTKLQLRRHQLRHASQETGSAADKACPYAGCGFKTKSGSHLRRHVRLHTGTKPYKCRHCDYASSNVENLRKHVLSTNIHPGKCIYECEICIGKQLEPFCTNFSKELRAHLLEAHADKFPKPNDASAYIFRLFEVDGDGNAKTGREAGPSE